MLVPKRTKHRREFLLATPHIVWHGNLIDNPAHVLNEGAFELIEKDGYWVIRILADSYFDDLPVEQRPYLVQHVDIPVELGDAVATGGSPVVSREKLPESVFALLAGVAGVGSVSAAGDEIKALLENQPEWLRTARTQLAEGRETAKKETEETTED